jgi:CopG family transcriptional regulator/antitoxin EndoAI
VLSVSKLRRVVITVPDALLEEVDSMVSLSKGKSRSELVGEALHQFIEERKRRELQDRMKAGYLFMAKINLQLAEEGLCTEGDVDEVVQLYLAASEGE